MKIVFLNEFLKTIKKNYIAPNILMTLFSKKEYVVNIDHFKREKGDLKWSLIKLIKFGSRLLFDLYDYKKNF